jgi:hypothetical protein
MYFHKDFYLAKAINDQISLILSSGIMSHIIEKYVDMQYWNVKTAEKGPQKLSIEHLQGAFNLLAILSLLSALVFILEVLLKWKIYQKVAVNNDFIF